MTAFDAVLFDLDRTLIDCNSGWLWAQAEWRAGRIGWGRMAWAAWWLGRYSLGLSGGLDEVARKAAATVAGEREAELADRTRAWFEAEIRHRLRPGAARALAQHRDQGARMVLATTSTSYAAELAAEAFGLHEVVCTRLEVVDGVLTGKLSSLAFGSAKAERVVEWAARAGIDLSKCAFYTDSATDVGLLERVGYPIAVEPDRSLARIAKQRGWPVVSWGTAGGVPDRPKGGSGRTPGM
jgi:HAD superfamily hydrolase (TIGR01490 family)